MTLFCPVRFCLTHCPYFGPLCPALQGGDKLTLSLNNAVTNGGGNVPTSPAAVSPGSRIVSSTTNGSSAHSTPAAATVAKLINLDSPDDDGGTGNGNGVVSSTTDVDGVADTSEKKESVCVTHFSSAGDGGVERETLFSDTIASMLANDSKNPFTNGGGKNPFLEDNDVSNNGGGNPFNSKYATIDRSNPFSSSPSSSNNPFLEDSGKKAADKSPVDPTPTLRPELTTATATTKTLNKIVSTVDPLSCYSSL